MKRSFYFIVPVLLLLCSCEEYEPYIEGNGFKQSLSELNCFDFKTEREVYVDINYGLSGPGALLNLYTYDPVSYENGETGCFSLEGEPSFKVFADENGRFCGNVLLPTYAKKLWIVSTSFGAPFCLTADIVDGKAVLDASQFGRWNVKNTRAGEEPTGPTIKDGDDLIHLDNGGDKIFALTKWDEYGKVGANDDIFHVVSPVHNPTIDAATSSNLKILLWNGQETVKPNRNLDNSKYITDTKHTNITIAKEYIDENKKTQKVECSNVWFNFIDEWAWHMNTIGYYYYPTDEEPERPDGLDKFIIIPNASKTGHEPFKNIKDNQLGINGTWPWQWYNYGDDKAPCAMNTKVQLLYRYKDENGNIKVTENFPPGITIGFFIIPNEHKPEDRLKVGTYRLPESSDPTQSSYRIPDISGAIYSNNNWNKDKNKHTISMTLGGKVIVGFEDGGDNSYEDILFNVESNPKLAIYDEVRPDIEFQENKIISKTNKFRTYLYEDIWPSGGDCDLNDAVIEHKTIITTVTTIQGSTLKTKIDMVEDKFKVIRSDAYYTNAFAIKMPEQGEIKIGELPEGCIVEEETGCIILFDQLNQQVGKEVTITRTELKDANGNYLTSDTSLDLKTETLNPFIIAQYDPLNRDGRTEIHLPGHSTTKFMNEKIIGMETPYFYNYVKSGGKHPFALSLPIKDFKPSPERMNIEDFYEGYSEWVESNGEKNPDWYLHPKK